MSNTDTVIDYTELETETLWDKKTDYQTDLNQLYDADISNEDYWRVFHHINQQIKLIDEELKVRNSL